MRGGQWGMEDCFNIVNRCGEDLVHYGWRHSPELEGPVQCKSGELKLNSGMQASEQRCINFSQLLVMDMIRCDLVL